MLKDLVGRYSVLHFAGKEYRTKFSLNCMLCLEMMYKPLSEILKLEYTDWSEEDVLQLARAAMCDLKENKEAVDDREFRRVQPSLFELGMIIKPEDIPALRLELANCIFYSLPDPRQSSSDDENSPHRYYTDEGHLRALYVNVMGNSEDDFWNKNRRELEKEVDRYLEVKGLKERAVVVKTYDD